MLKQRRLSQKGNAVLEIVPILAIFVLLVNFSLGFFGLIHSGILNSIGARNYAFETFRNRSDLTYLRDATDQAAGNFDFTYKKSGLRFHVVKNEFDLGKGDDKFYATRRPIKISDIKEVENELGNNDSYHQKIKGITEGQRASDAGIDEGVNPAWVRTAYGICLTSKCGG